MPSETDTPPHPKPLQCGSAEAPVQQDAQWHCHAIVLFHLQSPSPWPPGDSWPAWQALLLSTRCVHHRQQARHGSLQWQIHHLHWADHSFRDSDGSRHSEGEGEVFRPPSQIHCFQSGTPESSRMPPVLTTFTIASGHPNNKNTVSWSKTSWRTASCTHMTSGAEGTGITDWFALWHKLYRSNSAHVHETLENVETPQLWHAVNWS